MSKSDSQGKSRFVMYVVFGGLSIFFICAGYLVGLGRQQLQIQDNTEFRKMAAPAIISMQKDVARLPEMDRKLDQAVTDIAILKSANPHIKAQSGVCMSDAELLENLQGFIPVPGAEQGFRLERDKVKRRVKGEKVN